MVKPTINISSKINTTKNTSLKAYLVSLAFLLIIAQSIVTQALVWTIQNRTLSHMCDAPTHQSVKILETTAGFFQNLVADFKHYLEEHPYTSPISSTTFTSLLVLYYENTHVQIEFAPITKASDTQDHYQNLYHYLFLAKIPHPPQYLG
ncbi:hypothetical protein BKI52_22280 [marine bacterium AO1-C]|nr:hypothetical protein BKI52_22280 [marine bacterium AO1-C]